MAHGAMFDPDDPGQPYPEGGDDAERKRLALADWRRLLEHPDVAMHTDQGGRTSVHRADTLLVAVDDLDDARLLANRDDLGIDRDELEERRRDAAESGIRVVPLRLARRLGVVAATEFLRALDGRRPLQVGPDHLLFPAQGWSMGPSSMPRPARPPRFRPEPGALKRAPAVRVAVLDSGLVEHTLDTDPLLAFATDANQPVPFVDPAWDGVSEALRQWVGGHGTHVAGVLAAAAADVGGAVQLRHHAVATFFADPDVMPVVADSDVAAAISAAVADGCRVLNLSLGGPTARRFGTLATGLALEAANAGRKGDGGRDIVLIASAGNEATTEPMFPAAAKGVIAVGALEKAPGRSRRGLSSARRAVFSNHGPWVDCATAGVGIVGPYVTGKGGPDSAGARKSFRGWASWSGTSFAAPHVAGRIAGVLGSGSTPSARVAAALVLAAGEPLDPTLGLGVFVR